MKMCEHMVNIGVKLRVFTRCVLFYRAQHMNFKRINIDKSIKQEKLIPKWLIERFSEYFSFFIILGFMPVAMGALVHGEIERRDALGFSIFLFLVAIFLSALIYKKSIKRIYDLKRIKGLSPDKNREILRKIVKSANWHIFYENETIFVCGPKTGFSWTWRREVIALFDNKDLLINSMSFGSGGLVSPFHWIEDRSVENVIMRKIDEEIKTTHNMV
jgi:uncharacterized membrane protein (DUF485 family)